MFALKKKTYVVIGAIVAVISATAFSSYAFANEENTDTVQDSGAVSETVTENATDNSDAGESVNDYSNWEREVPDSVRELAEKLKTNEEQEASEWAAENGYYFCPDILIPDPEERRQWHIDHNYSLRCLDRQFECGAEVLNTSAPHLRKAQTQTKIDTAPYTTQSWLTPPGRKRSKGNRALAGV